MGAETHTVADSAAMMDVLSSRIYGGSGSCTEAIQTTPSSMRIHMCLESPIGPVDPDVRERVQETGRLLESLGHRVVEVVATGRPFRATIDHGAKRSRFGMDVVFVEDHFYRTRN